VLGHAQKFVSKMLAKLRSSGTLAGFLPPGGSLAQCHISGKFGSLAQLMPCHNSGNHTWDIFLLALFLLSY